MVILALSSIFDKCISITSTSRPTRISSLLGINGPKSNFENKKSAKESTRNGIEYSLNEIQQHKGTRDVLKNAGTLKRNIRNEICVAELN